MSTGQQWFEETFAGDKTSPQTPEKKRGTAEKKKRQPKASSNSRCPCGSGPGIAQDKGDKRWYCQACWDEFEGKETTEVKKGVKSKNKTSKPNEGEATTLTTSGANRSESPVTGSSNDATFSSSLLHECYSQQLIEFDMLSCIYSDDIAVITPEEDIEKSRQALQEKGEDEIRSSDLKKIQFSVKLLSEAPALVGEEVVAEAPFNFSVEVTMPKNYPLENAFEWSIDCPTITKIERDELLRIFNEHAKTFAGNCCVQSVFEAVKEKLLEMRGDMARESLEDLQKAQEELEWESAGFDWLNAESKIGRRCVYFHHILSTAKRQCIASWARSLKLNGFAKIGYPGILLVEGPEVAAEEYVRLLQRLRWKLMVVRGEECFDVPPGETLDSMRKITSHVGVVETISSSEIGEVCHGCGLGDLFRTAMKIYKN